MSDDSTSLPCTCSCHQNPGYHHAAPCCPQTGMQYDDTIPQAFADEDWKRLISLRSQSQQVRLPGFV